MFSLCPDCPEPVEPESPWIEIQRPEVGVPYGPDNPIPTVRLTIEDLAMGILCGAGSTGDGMYDPVKFLLRLVSDVHFLIEIDGCSK